MGEWGVKIHSLTCNEENNCNHCLDEVSFKTVFLFKGINRCLHNLLQNVQEKQSVKEIATLVRIKNRNVKDYLSKVTGQKRSHFYNTIIM